MKKLKLKEELYNDDIDFTMYGKEDLLYLMEFSYVLGVRKDLVKNLQDLFDYTESGIDTFGLFVMFLYDRFGKSGIADYCQFIIAETEDTIEDFKNYYFEEI